ncbi:hypothetical protein PKCBPO_00406 [Methylorubrum thiocyanatum]
MPCQPLHDLNVPPPAVACTTSATTPTTAHHTIRTLGESGSNVRKGFRLCENALIW